LNFGMSNNINNVTWVLLGGLDCSIWWCECDDSGKVFVCSFV
jgi:hypothetical protein